MAVATTVCPPHHWWIEEQPGGVQRWQCYRCGSAEQREALPPAERPFAAWTPRQQRGDADTME